MEKKRIISIVVMLMLALGNYSRLTGNENVRNIQFLSIFLIGVFSGLLLRELLVMYKSKSN